MVVWPVSYLPVGTGRNFPHPVPFSELENALGAAVPLSGCCIACGLQELEPSRCQGQQVDRLGHGNGRTAWAVGTVDSLTVRAGMLMNLGAGQGVERRGIRTMFCRPPLFHITESF